MTYLVIQSVLTKEINTQFETKACRKSWGDTELKLW